MAYWQKITQVFAANPYVIGYDPINEPSWSGKTALQVIKNLLPGEFDKDALQPLYERVYVEMKKAGGKKIMMFEPATMPDTFELDLFGYY